MEASTHFPTPSVSERRISYFIFGVLLAFNVWAVSVGWKNEFLPGNEFRQTQTAITTVFIQREHNFSLAYPTPVLGKPWSVPFEFPLYQWTVVRISDATGMSLTSSGRFVSAACFYLSLPAGWILLGRLGVRNSRRLVALTMLLSCPLYIFYARAFLIETMALLFSLWFLAAFVAAVRDRSYRWLIVANVAGIAAGLEKVTTFALYLVPAGVASVVWLWRVRPWSAAGPARLRPVATMFAWIAGGTVAPFVATVWWTRYADTLKNLNPSARNLMTGVMNSYTFGTAETRRSAALWQSFGHTIVTHLTPLLTLGAFALVLAVWGGKWRRWILACLVAFAAGPLIFPILYSWHEYYFTANGVLLMAAVGLALCALLESARSRLLVWTIITLIHASQLWTYFHVLYPTQAFGTGGSNGLTRLIQDITGPDDVLLIAGEDWAPMLPYHSQRRALMIRRNMDTNMSYLAEAFKNLEGENVPLLIVRGAARENAALLEIARRYFDFETEPIATWRDSALYVNATFRPHLIEKYHTSVYEGIALSARSVAEIDALQFAETKTASLTKTQREMFRIFSPEPVRFSSRFALGLIDLNPRLVLMAHPNTRLFFAPESGPRRIFAKFGILPNAYENVPPPDTATEGVLFSIVRLRHGSSETLFKRVINPRDHAEDRGPQTADVAVAVQPGDEFAFMTQPGPTGGYNRTWSYWETITIK